MAKRIVIPDKMPLIVLRPSSMLLPTTMATIFLSHHPDIISMAQRPEDLTYVFLCMEKVGDLNEKGSLYETGVVARIVGVGKNQPALGLKGEYRAKLLEVIETGQDVTYYTAHLGDSVTDTPDKFFKEIDGEFIIAPEYANSIRALLSIMLKRIRKILSMDSELIGQGWILLESIEEVFEKLDTQKRSVIDTLIWQTALALPNVSGVEKQELIDSLSLMSRLKKCLNLLEKNVAVMEVERNLGQKSKRRSRRVQIGKGENKPPRNTTDQGSDQLDDDWFTSNDPALQKKYKLFCEIRDSIKDPREKETFIEVVKREIIELQTFEKSRGGDATQTSITNACLDFILALPWGKKSDETVDFNEFERVFEDGHYGLGKVKDSVTDFIAAKRSNPDGKSGVLLLVGPPGVGKTSVCMSIAEGLKRKYVRMSLGGIRDEADIRGHRRTYIKALPGRILAEIKKAGTKNPVFVLDEIDKIGKDSFRGDPSDALLEVLDPEQNWSFTDHYLEAPFDLSQVLFICTANSTSTILPALLDRMEPIHFSSYTEEAKVQIAKKFLIPKALKNVGLEKDGFELKWEDNDPDEILLKLIRGYTKEAGVRNIERMIAKILRRIVKEEQRKPGYIKDVVITEELIEKIHGIPRYTKTRANETKIGEIIGLAWTETGGEILYIQSAVIPKQGETVLSQTGQLGSVMREADKLALSLQRIRLAELNKTNLIENKLIHLHIPQGAIPKDGPSAGITACFSLESAILKKVARPKLAMTGEITLSGMVTAVGGIKEKVIAAANAGIEILILPKTNEKDYREEVPDSAKKKFTEIYFVESIDEARPIVFPEN